MTENTFDTAFNRISQLVADFQANEKRFITPDYSEAQARIDFIDKSFIALGWDVNHESQTNPYAQEVKVERGVKTGATARKRADYAFLAANFRDVRFFVEAKKPFVELDTPDNCFQVVRYGWSANAPLSILTDFQGLRVLDCRYKPDVQTAMNRIVKTFHYTDYANKEKFAEIYYLFGRDAVLNNSLETFAANLHTHNNLGKAGKQSKLFKSSFERIDTTFLLELDEIRGRLAMSFKATNPNFDGEGLTEATQKTIDRLVFMRFLEDKLIEETPIFEDFERSGGGVWQSFINRSRELDRIYNGIIFKSHVIDAPTFKVDADVFGQICAELSPKESPYDFNAIPIEILGNIYERFLGKIIVVDETTGAAKIEEKPEVRKAGGVYYTPEYIVRYIVENTVGELVRGKTPQETETLRFADIACGSGSFLIGVYDYLLRFHAEFYNKPKNRKAGIKAGCIETETGSLRLNLAQRTNILLDNVFGVDVDAQAVEVSQLSLFLKLLEDETTASARKYQQQKFKLLPTLDKNIVHGNALIDWDILEGQLFETREQRKLNPMSYVDRFPQIMKTGGFDAIVGNPPYVRIQTMQENAPMALDYFKRNYEAAVKGNYDIYVVFVEQALRKLNGKAKLGYILPHKFFNAKYGESLRALLAKGKNLSHIVHFSDQQIFYGATTYTALLFANKAATEQIDFVKVADLAAWRKNGASLRGLISSSSVTASEWNFTVGESYSLFEKLCDMPFKLGDVAQKIFVGLQTSADTVFLFKNSYKSNSELTKLFSKELNKDVEIETELLKPVVRSGEIGRYFANPSALVVFPYFVKDNKATLIPESVMKVRFPNAWNYLITNKELLSRREHGKFKDSGWHQLYPKNLEHWEQNKIMMPYMITKLSAFYDDASNYFVNVTTGGFAITVKEQFGSMKYFTGILNSKLLDWFLKKISTNFHGGYFAANKQFLVQLPIRVINFDDKKDVARHDKMTNLVEQMLVTKREQQNALTDSEQNFYWNKIAALDRQIDALVYELYELTTDEIGIIENG